MSIGMVSRVVVIRNGKLGKLCLDDLMYIGLKMNVFRKLQKVFIVDIDENMVFIYMNKKLVILRQLVFVICVIFCIVGRNLFFLFGFIV